MSKFTVTNSLGPGELDCSDTSHVWSSAQVLFQEPDASLSDWDCSVAEVFASYESLWNPEALAVDSTVDNTLTDSTGSSGVPYISSRQAISTGCGNSILETNYGEQCDMGPSNGNSICTTDCLCAVGIDPDTGECAEPDICGNGVIDTALGEECDNGDLLNGSDGNECNSDCTCTLGTDGNGDCIQPNTCGNGFTEEANDEVCDNGVDNGNDGICSTDCTCAVGIDPDTGLCAEPNVCGNGLTESGNNEECDNGDTLNGSDGNTCLSDCTCALGLDDNGACIQPNVCGNGVFESGNNEFCDYVPENRADGVCSSTCTCIYDVLDEDEGICKDAPVCGDGVTEDPEECEPSVDGSDVCNASTCKCIYDVDANGACNPIPDIPDNCGDGVLDSDEECEPDRRN